jgi:thiol-disulfide isomerase/thioredoxin
MGASRILTGEIGRRRLLAILGAGAVLTACGEAADSQPAPAPTAAASTDVSSFPAGETRPATDFTFEAYQGADLLGGETVRFSQILAAGKPVVLNFWAALCPPCRVEMPDLDHAYQAASDRILMAEELGVTYPVGTTSDATVMQRFQVLGMPTTTFITSQSQIIRQWTGSLDEAATTELIDELVQASGG